MAEKPKRLGFLIFPGFPMSCLSSAIEPLRAANEISGQEAFKWTLISESGQAINCSAGLPFQPEIALKDVSDVDMLFLLSEPNGRFENPSPSNAKLRYLVRHGTHAGAVSGGVFPLARAGLLTGHVCSVHWCYRTAFEAEFPEIETTDDVIILDQRCRTAAGAAGAFDLSLHLVESALGEAVMTEVACWFQHPLIRNQGVRQNTPAFRTHNTADRLPSKVSQAVKLFSENLEFPLTTREVANQVGISSRQLERSFKQATGQSPGEYYRQIRMRAARQLVIHTQNSLASIALAVGYANLASMSRNYIELFGFSPNQERRDIGQFRINRNIPVP
ncbi:GlxA family transcriptional regulator [Ruegeria denitrificans]|nr:GlxA family transcriptional regulator [Ruegeria denitrificans]